jgi:hypothetical protein
MRGRSCGLAMRELVWGRGMESKDQSRHGSGIFEGNDKNIDSSCGPESEKYIFTDQGARKSSPTESRPGKCNYRRSRKEWVFTIRSYQH